MLFFPQCKTFLPSFDLVRLDNTSVLSSYFPRQRKVCQMVGETSEALNYCDFISETWLPLDLLQIRVYLKGFRPGWLDNDGCCWQTDTAGEGDSVGSDEQQGQPQCCSAEWGVQVTCRSYQLYFWINNDINKAKSTFQLVFWRNLDEGKVCNYFFPLIR